ncbi:MAG TPA: hypothetical protein VK898_12085 [Chloroflexota bacterium]|nr:hypothetical protein [Chloroflexota bacterium]
MNPYTGHRYGIRMVRQCAWCWLVADAMGRYLLQPGEKLREATHGICPTCEARERAIIDGHRPGRLGRLTIALAS